MAVIYRYDEILLDDSCRILNMLTKRGRDKLIAWMEYNYSDEIYR